MFETSPRLHIRQNGRPSLVSSDTYPCPPSLAYPRRFRHVSGFDNLISRTSTAALVLHPIGWLSLFGFLFLSTYLKLTVAGLTFLTLLISLFILRRGSNGTSRLPSLITLGVGILTAVLATIVFLIDVILVALVRHRVHNETNGDLVLNWGNAVCSDQGS
jgi:hypothetical protein